jgi:HAD superfamily hydrolase (TIGR01490 family)
MNLALFDLDYTLLAGDSDHAWGEFLVSCGLIDGEEYRRKNDHFWANYKAGILDIHAYLEFALSFLAGRSVVDMAPLHADYLEHVVKPMIHHNALNLVRHHRERGDLTAIVTATNAFLTAPMKDLFAVDHLIACEVEIVDGHYTGRSIGVPSMREGKITRVESWLAESGRSIASFERSYFYSDSLNDLPLLSVVTHPVAVNPDATLRDHAKTQGWPIHDLIEKTR